MKLRMILPAALLLLLVVVSCQRKRFDVVMQLTDNGVQRSVSTWAEETVDSNGHSEERIIPLEESGSNGLAAVYGPPEQLPDGRTRYAHEFTGDLPTDLADGPFHNFARAQVIRSPLGVTVSYVERMPGQTDMLAVARAAQESCDQLIAAWIAYAAQQPEFRESPDKLALLKSFLEKDLRADMLNLGLTLWLEYGAAEAYESADTSTNGASPEQRMIARSAAFLLERGYVRTGDTVGLADNTLAISRGVARRIADELGYPADAPLPPSLAAFADGKISIENITSSGLTALGKTDADLSTNATLIIGDFVAETPKGQVTWMNVPHQPVTNGTWDAKTQSIVWQTKYHEGAQLPEVLVANFTVPQTEFLNEHFGNALSVDTVGKFNTWYATLTAKQQTVTSAFCTNLKPGPTLRADILRFDLSAPEGRAATPGDCEKLPAGIEALLPKE